MAQVVTRGDAEVAKRLDRVNENLDSMNRAIKSNAALTNWRARGGD
jgi:hypothetical protein